jgi:putative PIN family toxin of toxin-antitoxin system
MLKELRAVLKYPTVRRMFPDLDEKQIERIIHQLAFRATLVRKVRHVFDYPRARQDEPYIDLAAAVKADYLVSRDRDLLTLATDHSLLGKQFRRRFARLRCVSETDFVL